MDKNTIIGVTLIAVLLLVYFNYVSPTPSDKQPVDTKKDIADPGKDVRISTDSTGIEDMSAVRTTVRSDSFPITKNGLFTLLQGREQDVHIENEDMALSFSSRGGILKQVRLKKFTAYGQRPLYLLRDGSSTFSLLTKYQGHPIDLYALHYEINSYAKDDSTIVTFTAFSEKEDAFVKQVYTLPVTGYKLGYHIEIKGQDLSDDLLTFTWHNRLVLQEQHMEDSRKRTTINYYTAANDFDDLSALSSKLETKSEADPIKWVAMRQKFFISALIANQPFRGGEMSSTVNAPANSIDTATVKDLRVQLFIGKQDVTKKEGDFMYFFGPTAYDLLSNVTPGFSKNLNLGWPPILWVNKFIIIPIFKFLERYISSYGIIIVILVLIIKLALSPLSYKSYLSMAKMKLLKPELDLLKEKYKEDMSKIQQEQLKLYQQVGVSPFSGCVPLVLQMPVLFAMFYFFPLSIELRQSGFLWAEDLSTYDSVLNLPFTIPFYGNHVSLFVLLMTASTIVYTWQNNQISSAQGPMKSISYIMPVVFMFVLNSFSAGLSFYYLVANLVTFAQQALIRKFVDEEKIKSVMEEHRKKMLSGKGKRSRLMSKLQEAMKAGEEQRKRK